ncbi:MAG: hypothetical protein CME62_04375 [Halobacteriovoraceae bacterium]|nr:hypothetical protein [Halobacteriovoraceae bacterium]|tara:strand:+ start:16488 stop:17180 length:693 start_codon:yes stop_codon:yes gene_type:complete
MKIEKFIKLGLVQAFIFLLFATAITGCQKKNFDKTGHYAQVNLNTRAPASADGPELQKFLKYQDPKQIYLFCALSSPKKTQCYKQHFQHVMSKFESKYGKFTREETAQVQNKFAFKVVEAEVKQVKQHILDKIDPELYNIVTKRSSFCEKNSTIHLDRCMTQFKNKDTLMVLNHYQKRNKQLNAHEYLYTQNFILEELETRLIKAAKNLKEPTPTVRIPAYDHKGVQKDI